MVRMSCISELNVGVRDDFRARGRVSEIKSLVTVRERSLKKLSTRECTAQQIHPLLKHVYTWALYQFKNRINAHKKSRNKDG